MLKKRHVPAQFGLLILFLSRSLDLKPVGFVVDVGRRLRFGFDFAFASCSFGGLNAQSWHGSISFIVGVAGSLFRNVTGIEISRAIGVGFDIVQIEGLSFFLKIDLTLPGFLKFIGRAAKFGHYLAELSRHFRQFARAEENERNYPDEQKL